MTRTDGADPDRGQHPDIAFQGIATPDQDRHHGPGRGWPRTGEPARGVGSDPGEDREDRLGGEHGEEHRGDRGYDHDLIVIGGGAVGENVADCATRRGLSVALLEADLVGGECSYWACMPSKALLRSPQVLRDALRVRGAREAVTGRLDAAEVLARRSDFTSHWRDVGQAQWVDSAGIELVRGRGELVGVGLVRVGERTLRARAVALATGSVPVLPPIPGLAEARPWGTREATAVQEVPARLLVLGGGAAAVELALAHASLGSRVTVLSRSRLLRREEPFVADFVTEGLEREGVEVHTGVTPTGVYRGEDGIVTATLADGSTLRAEEILVATGRRPNTAGLGLEALGIGEGTAGGGPRLEVDDTLLVRGTDWLYAVGDVNGRVMQTHQGKYQARAAGEAIAARRKGEPVEAGEWGRHAATADHLAAPRVVFTDPEVASVGLTEAQAHECDLRARAVEYDLGAVAGASLEADGYTGRVKLVIDLDRQVVVGATFVGQDVAELVHAATVAIVGEVPIDRLWHAVPAYPTVSEIWLRLLETYRRPGA